MYVQHSTDDNTQRFETRTLRIKVALRRKNAINTSRKKRNHWKIQLFIIPDDIRGKFDFPSSTIQSCSQPMNSQSCPPSSRCCHNFFSYSTLSIFIFIETKKHKRHGKCTLKEKANGIQKFKELIDKTSEKLIRCEIQFDVTLFLCRVSNSF